MKTVEVAQSFMERVLTVGLNVLVMISGFDTGMEEGDVFRMREISPEGVRTGRDFYARVKHSEGNVSVGIFQFDLASYMDQDDGTGHVDRLPMAGDFANEKITLPDGAWKACAFKVSGEKPVWVYEGVKWRGEVSLHKIAFKQVEGEDFFKDKSKEMSPLTVVLKVQQQGGEKFYVYNKAGEVEA
ncbi:MAG TPA: hypothetical protein VHQ01_12655 [Pyrinomonadaceae bacterium]|jgi:hypothetical protein|nr:hypothetical protein [Pyrinomonadaceae bacterium]